MEVLKDISQLTKGCGVTFEELKKKQVIWKQDNY